MNVHKLLDGHENPKFDGGLITVFDSQFASGWSSFDFDGDVSDQQCAEVYANVTQNYSACWNYNLGADANESDLTDSGWGPHVYTGYIAAPLGFVTDGTEYTRVRRILRWTKW